MSFHRQRRTLFWLCITACVSVACESEEDKVAGVVEELAGELPLRANEAPAARAERIEARFAPVLAADFEVVAPFVEEGGSKSFAVNAATGIEAIFPLIDLRLSDLEVSLSSSKRRAHARGTARVSGAQPGDLHAFDLVFEADLSKVGALWRVTRAELSRPNRDLPEARP